MKQPHEYIALALDNTDNIDTSAINAAVTELRKFENAHEVGDKISNILQSVLNGDYEEAEKCIDTLLGVK